ncbi:adenylate cyclase [Mesorhizobium albiziae]|uniref:Adenylate cyclase n=1 Tax=Neomesorhizobium albiziae TaxID=335020 RepID=A0A1I3WCD3_9HYPH|nr:adenylate/guanylate cyclase domain-containing protein [Mesorhizobium albiziae]GLS31458.1 adenylate cyclase [Mesorhizobium albiziae]SFK04076.1 adenylate cyclase [Mesorhizobium albiziae]
MAVTFSDQGTEAARSLIPSGLELRRRKRLGAMLARAERDGARLQFWARSSAMAAIALFFLAFAKWDAALAFTIGMLAVFFLLGLFYYRLVQRRLAPTWLGTAIGTLDIVLLTFLIVGTNPFSTAVLPPALHLREGAFAYLLIFVSLGALTLSPRLVLWLGLVTAISWSAAVSWVVMQPGIIVASKLAANLSLADRMQMEQNPNFVDIIAQSANVVLILIVTGILAMVVSRSRRLADDYIVAERARINLARHFSPNMVDELASADEPFGPVRRQDIAIVFADIVGFTKYSEDHPAEDVFELLREFHRRMEQVVFDHGGTVDNYIGDCIMATFGVPQAAEDDAGRALRCAQAMAASVKQWNARRVAAGEDPVNVGVGAQYGPVIVGAVGSERSLSIAVVGDACNVASRLQALCRDLDADICLGANLIEAVRREGSADFLSGIVDHGPVSLRGRDEPVHVFTVPKA